MTKFSWVWEYFDDHEGGAKCKLCNAILKTNNSTSSLNKHLTLKHRLKRRDDDSVGNISSGDFDGSIDEPASPTSSPSSCDTMPPAKLRKTLTDAVRSEEIFEALAKMIVLDNLPLSFVSGEGYHGFMSKIEPAFVVPSESMLESRLQLQYTATKLQVEHLLSEATYVALSTDRWSASPHVTYITVKAHYIDTDWKENKFTLSTVALADGETTFDTRLMEVADAWNLKDKVVAIVTDNTADMEAAVRKCGLPEFSLNLTCAAHTLHLCVTQALQDPAIVDILERVSKLVGHFHHSATAAKELCAMQISFGIKEQALMQSSPYNWVSTYFMLKSVLESRVAIEATLKSQKETRLSLSNSEWKVLEEFTPLLEPLQLATTTFTGPGSPTSLVRPIINSIVNMHYAKSEQTGEGIRDPNNPYRHLPPLFKKTMRRLLIDRFQMSDGELIETRQLAALIDPRFKDMFHETQQGRSAIISAVRALVGSSSDCQACTSSEITEDGKPKTTMMDILFGKMYSPQEPSNQLDAFSNEVQLCHNDCPLSWWKSRATKYPALADLAKKLLCIPAASAAAERVYSTTSADVVLAKRSALAPHNVDMLVFLNQNNVCCN